MGVMHTPIRQLRVRAPMSQPGRNMAGGGRWAKRRGAVGAGDLAWPLLDGRAGSSRATFSSAVRS